MDVTLQPRAPQKMRNSVTIKHTAYRSFISTGNRKELTLLSALSALNIQKVKAYLHCEVNKLKVKCHEERQCTGFRMLQRLCDLISDLLLLDGQRSGQRQLFLLQGNLTDASALLRTDSAKVARR